MVENKPYDQNRIDAGGELCYNNPIRRSGRICRSAQQYYDSIVSRQSQFYSDLKAYVLPFARKKPHYFRKVSILHFEKAGVII